MTTPTAPADDITLPADQLPLIASTSPERIWLDVGEEAATHHTETRFRDLHEVTWSEDNASGYGVEYVRADRASPSRAAVPAPRDEDQRTRGHMGSTPDGGIDDHDEPNLPESLTLEVDAWFARNTGLGGCSDKDAAELAAIFYDVTYEGGRESIEDALAVVESFGPGTAGLNDTFARQVLLAAEVHRLRGLYEMAVKGRSEMREALREERATVQPEPAAQAAPHHSVACLYNYTLARLGLVDTPQMRLLFWDANDALEFDPATDRPIPPIADDSDCERCTSAKVARELAAAQSQGAKP